MKAACFLDNPLPFCKDVNSASVIIAILRREAVEQQETIFARLLSAFPILAFSDPAWSVAHEMVNVGTIRHKLQMTAMIQRHLLPTVRYLPCVEKLLVHLMSSIPAQSRKIFVGNTKEALKPMNTSLINSALADMERVDRLTELRRLHTG
jgi:hypothetical protein